MGIWKNVSAHCTKPKWILDLRELLVSRHHYIKNGHNSVIQIQSKFKFFLKNLDTMSSRVNKGGTIQLVISTQFWGLQQHMLSSRFCLFQGHPCTFQQDNVKLHTLPFRKAWRCSSRVWTVLSVLQTSDLTHHQSKKYTREDTRPLSDKNQITFFSQLPNNWSQFSSQMFAKEEGKKRAPSQRFWHVLL